MNYQLHVLELLLANFYSKKKNYFESDILKKKIIVLLSSAKIIKNFSLILR